MNILNKKQIAIINKRQNNFSKKYKIYSGFDCIVILTDKLVFRFPKDKEAKNKIKTEEILFKFLDNKLNIPIPKYKIESKKEGIVSYNIFIGKEFKFKSYYLLNKTKQNEICRELGIFLKKIHSLSIIPSIKSRLSFDDWSKICKKLRKDFEKYIFPDFKEKDIITINNFLNLLEKKFKNDKKNCFVHGDFSGDNLVVDFCNGKIKGVIDFGDARISNPAIDFYYFWFDGKKLVSKIISYYTKDELEQKKLLYNSKLYFLYINLLMMVIYKKNKNSKFFYRSWNIFKKTIKTN